MPVDLKLSVREVMKRGDDPCVYPMSRVAWALGCLRNLRNFQRIIPVVNRATLRVLCHRGYESDIVHVLPSMPLRSQAGIIAKKPPDCPSSSHPSSCGTNEDILSEVGDTCAGRVADGYSFAATSGCKGRQIE